MQRKWRDMEWMEHYSKNLLNEKKGIADLKLAIPSLAMSTNLCQQIYVKQ